MPHLTRTRRILIAGGAVFVAAVAISLILARRAPLVLTGIVATNDVIVSPQVAGQVAKLLVVEGDQVNKDQLLAVLVPDELEADRAFYAYSAAGSAGQVAENEATLRYQERQTTNTISQSSANLAAAEAEQAEAAANLKFSANVLSRNEGLRATGAVAAQDLDQARNNYAVAKARLDAANRQVAVQRAAVALAKSTAEQVAARRSALHTSQQQRAAASAESTKAVVRLGYTELRAPISGIVDVRAARTGEFVNPGQPVVTLINQDDLWIRADVEETYIDKIHLGDRFTVRLPSGVERVGTVYFRGVDADFATQRDVSRSKRDIKTFEIRLRVDNRDRRLAVGMTAYVILPASLR